MIKIKENLMYLSDIQKHRSRTLKNFISSKVLSHFL
jgi:hypothetical protein